MARSKLVMTVLGAAAVLAVAGCGSVTAADAGSASHASATTGGASSGGAAASPSGGGSTAPSPGQVNGTGGPIGAVAGLLCAAPAAVNRVLITRTGMSGPMLPSGPRISAFVTSANPPTPGLLVQGAGPARALAKAVCGLPAMTGTVLHCPLLGLPGYRLDLHRRRPHPAGGPGPAVGLPDRYRGGPGAHGLPQFGLPQAADQHGGTPAAARRRAPARYRGQLRAARSAPWPPSGSPGPEPARSPAARQPG